MKSLEDYKKKRRFSFIPKELYDELDDKVLDKLDDYREQYRKCVLKKKKIDRINRDLQKEKDNFKILERELIDKGQFLDILKKDFYFVVSVTRYKVKGNYYYNLCISRVSKGNPKNIYLGREYGLKGRIGIKEQLLKHYKNNKTFKKEIEKDWRQFLKDECNTGKTYTKIMREVIKNPLSIKEIKLTKDDLFPI